MEFTENFKQSNNFRIDGQLLYIIDDQNRELELFVSEEMNQPKQCYK